MEMTNQNKPMIVLIELGGSHDECLLSQIVALKNHGNRVLLICNKEIINRHGEFVEFLDDRLILDKEEVEKDRAKLISKLAAKINGSGAQKVILNTAQGSIVRDLSIRFLFSKIEFIGIIHTTRKLKGSFTQKLINQKVSRYFLLSKFLLDSVGGAKKNLDYFYPLRFPRFEPGAAGEDYNVQTIVIIGGVERRRKDLDGFLEMLKQIENQKLKFVFLGKTDMENEEVLEFRKQVERCGCGQQVKFYEEFVPQREFDAVMQRASLILPLIHPDTSSSEQYFKNQISGAMTVSFGYKVPMLIHGSFRNIEEMATASFYYQIDAFREALSFAFQNRDKKVGEMKENKEYDVEYQEKRYINFLFNVEQSS